MITGIPTQDKCSDTPEEFAAWAMVAMPSGPKDVPLLVHPSSLSQWSKHLYECGFRHHADLQAKWYHPPADDSAFAQMNGQWLDHPVETTSATTSMRTVVDSMTTEQRDALKAILEEE